MDVLIQIKRLVLAGRLEFTEKALLEMDLDGITREDVCESLVSADRISKTINSSSRHLGKSKEKLYIIKSRCFSGVMVYTKGKFARFPEADVFYVLISSKRAV